MHTTKGVELCKQYRIPAEIGEMCVEHHGTMPIFYFLGKAEELSDGKKLNVNDYRYTGTLPQSKIAAILMICDGAEAIVRSLSRADVEIVQEKVDTIIEERRRTKQFIDCPLTQYDLQIINHTIVNSFCGIRHQRVAYDRKKY
jgi:membrane-associated HD superfamily phosphohydrolase